jgi:hypothetical protein
VIYEWDAEPTTSGGTAFRVRDARLKRQRVRRHEHRRGTVEPELVDQKYKWYLYEIDRQELRLADIDPDRDLV